MGLKRNLQKLTGIKLAEYLINYMQHPLFVPQSNWRPPSQLTNFEKVIAIDLETCDPNLKQHGPGYKRNDGKVVGMLSSMDIIKVYAEE